MMMMVMMMVVVVLVTYGRQVFKNIRTDEVVRVCIILILSPYLEVDGVAAVVVVLDNHAPLGDVSGAGNGKERYQCLCAAVHRLSAMTVLQGRERGQAS